jgi:hypothetical protein
VVVADFFDGRELGSSVLLGGVCGKQVSVQLLGKKTGAESMKPARVARSEEGVVSDGTRPEGRAYTHSRRYPCYGGGEGGREGRDELGGAGEEVGGLEDYGDGETNSARLDLLQYRDRPMPHQETTNQSKHPSSFS